MTGPWVALVDTASLAVTALALGVSALVLARTGRLLPALGVLLELLTGAGLLRLAAAPTLDRALAAAGVLLVRQLATLGLRGGLPTAAWALRLHDLLRRAPALPRAG